MKFPLSTIIVLLMTIITFCSSEAIIPSVLGYYIKDVKLYGDLSQYMPNYWTISNLIDPTASRAFVCPSTSTLLGIGGPGKTSGSGYYERVYTGLPPHNKLALVFYTFIWGNWLPTDSIMISVDGKPVQTYYPSYYKRDTTLVACGSDNMIHFRMLGNVTHTGSTLTLRFTLKLATGSDATFTINDLNIKIFTSSAPTNLCATYGTTANDINSKSTCTCNVNEYRNSAGNCVTSCDTLCYHCYGPTASQCYQCRGVGGAGAGGGRQLVNGECSTYKDPACSSNCVYCEGTQCLLCSTGYHLNWDYTCSATCPTGYLDERTGNYWECKTPCQDSGKYMLSDFSCTETCESPFKTRTVGKAKFCDFPCDSYLTYLYDTATGTCISTCPTVVRNQGNYRFCDSCGAGTFRYDDGSCKSSCGSLMIQTPQGIYTLCDYPCPANHHLYPDKSCKLECPSPWIAADQDGVLVCQPSCANMNDYYAPRYGSCVSSCNPPYSEYSDNSVKVCRTACENNSTYALPSGQCANSCPSPLIERLDGKAKLCEEESSSWFETNWRAMTGFIAFAAIHLVLVLYLIYKRFMKKYKTSFTNYNNDGVNLRENADDVNDADQTSPELSVSRTLQHPPRFGKEREF